METIRYGVIGTGMMGVEHIDNLAAIDGAVVTAICDPDEGSRARGLAAVGDGVEVFDDDLRLIESGLCDAVILAAPNHTHHELLLHILSTDLHVLAEKPMCITTEECADVVDLADKREPVTWIGLEYRYMPPVARLIEEVRRGTVGAVQMVGIREHRFPFLEKVDNWNRFTANTGGTLVEKCCHFFDLMSLIADARPVRVMASGGQNVNHINEIYDGRSADILDNAFVIVEFPNGVRAMLDLCMFAEATHNQEELTVVGDRGKLEALIPEDVLRIGRRGEHWIGSVHEETVVDDRIRVEGLHHGSSYLEHVDFADAIRTGAPPRVSALDGLWSVAIGEAAHRSIDEGRPVDLAELVPTRFLES